jgi:hypothetical protein
LIGPVGAQEAPLQVRKKFEGALLGGPLKCPSPLQAGKKFEAPPASTPFAVVKELEIR